MFGRRNRETETKEGPPELAGEDHEPSYQVGAFMTSETEPSQRHREHHEIPVKKGRRLESFWTLLFLSGFSLGTIFTLTFMGPNSNKLKDSLCDAMATFTIRIVMLDDEFNSPDRDTRRQKGFPTGSYSTQCWKDSRRQWLRRK